MLLKSVFFFAYTVAYNHSDLITVGLRPTRHII